MWLPLPLVKLTVTQFEGGVMNEDPENFSDVIDEFEAGDTCSGVLKAEPLFCAIGDSFGV